MFLVRPISELTDSEVLDLLDFVSAEVKKRSSLNLDPEDKIDQDALKRATEAIASMFTRPKDL